MNTTKKKTMADTIQEEAGALELRSGGRGFVYVNKPYSCGVAESLSHFRPFEYLEFPAPGPGLVNSGSSKDGRATIERGQDYTTIALHPLKGSRKRRPYIVRLWI